MGGCDEARVVRIPGRTSIRAINHGSLVIGLFVERGRVVVLCNKKIIFESIRVKKFRLLWKKNFPLPPAFFLPRLPAKKFPPLPRTCHPPLFAAPDLLPICVIRENGRAETPWRCANELTDQAAFISLRNQARRSRPAPVIVPEFSAIPAPDST